MDSKNKNLIIEPDSCKSCGICVEFCPKGVLEIKEDKINIKDISRCIKCGLCELRCPDYAIYLEDDPQNGGNKNE